MFNAGADLGFSDGRVILRLVFAAKFSRESRMGEARTPCAPSKSKTIMECMYLHRHYDAIVLIIECYSTIG